MSAAVPEAIKGSRSLKHTRRGKEHRVNLLKWVKNLLAEEQGEMTIRHLFYLLVGKGVIEKTEREYQSLCRHLTRWRRSGDVDWGAFADSTRWHIKSPTFQNIDHALRNTAECYRRNLWANQKQYVEIWVEKDAIASIVSNAADSFGVPVFVARGFASLSSLYGSANIFRRKSAAGKDCILYYIGDRDPSGVNQFKFIVRAFRDDFNIDVRCLWVAVTREQIEQLNLPTRPTKKSNHSKGFEGDSVEIDSMPTAELRSLIERCITQHIDQYQWEQEKRTEEMERETLESIRSRFGRAA